MQASLSDDCIVFDPGLNTITMKHQRVPSFAKRNPVFNKVPYLNFLNKTAFGPIIKESHTRPAVSARYYIASVFLPNFTSQACS